MTAAMTKGPLPAIGSMMRGKVLGIRRNIKEFQKKTDPFGVRREKTIIGFADGYEAEYCPVAGQANLHFKEGDEVQYMVLYRGNAGDEIEIYPLGVGASSGTAPDFTQTRPVGTFTMQGHPAVFAFGFAKDMANAKGEWNMDIIKEDAEEIYNWLVSHRQ